MHTRTYMQMHAHMHAHTHTLCLLTCAGAKASADPEASVTDPEEDFPALTVMPTFVLCPWVPGAGLIEPLRCHLHSPT